MSIRDGFERAKPHLEALQNKKGAQATNARALLKLLPPMLDFLEDEQRRDSSPHDTFDAIGNAFGNMIGQALVTTTPKLERVDRLDEVLMQIRTAIVEQLRARQAQSGIILPERM